ncbi:AAA family ATPase, partial [Methanobrevibacter sp. OttesenSCG-928-I08]|nr:AAA family ATPase [Methanobrevibacter sp. OttesenSCG-928-I08]
AVEIGEKIRDVLIKGAETINLSKLDTVDDYEILDFKLNEIFSEIGISSSYTWVHKYYHMIFPDKLPAGHSDVWKTNFLNNLNIKPSSTSYGRSGQISLLAKKMGMGIHSFFYVVFKMFEEDIPGSEEIQIWLLAPGENAKLWEDFKEKNIIAIGWGELGNLNNYSSKKEIEKELQNKYPSNTKQTNNSTALFNFSREMKIGDLVIIKTGTRKLLGIGKITSNYRFSEILNEEYSQIRDVEWFILGDFDVEKHVTPLITKTLTNITKYDEDCRILSQIMNFPLNEYLNNPDGFEINHMLKKYNKEDFLNEVLFLEKDYDELVSLIKRKKNIILQGSPGVGKTFIAKRLAYSMMGVKDENRVEFIQFHQNYSYEDFIQGYRPKDEGFELNNGIFYEFCRKASKDPENDYYFIIDEVNRGNISKIFGELMMLIEEDKRGKDFEINLTYDTSEKFHVPENVHIIGMMNTADRSLAIIDYALRRRFVFYLISPLFDEDYENGSIFENYLLEKGVKEELASRIVSKFKSLNKKILNDEDLGFGFRIGHSYFTGEGSDEKWYNSVIEYEISPLLKEYWFDDLEKAEDEIKILLNI